MCNTNDSPTYNALPIAWYIQLIKSSYIQTTEELISLQFLDENCIDLGNLSNTILRIFSGVGWGGGSTSNPAKKINNSKRTVFFGPKTLF